MSCPDFAWCTTTTAPPSTTTSIATTTTVLPTTTLAPTTTVAPTTTTSVAPPVALQAQLPNTGAPVAGLFLVGALLIGAGGALIRKFRLS